MRPFPSSPQLTPTIAVNIVLTPKYLWNAPRGSGAEKARTFYYYSMSRMEIQWGIGGFAHAGGDKVKKSIRRKEPGAPFLASQKEKVPMSERQITKRWAFLQKSVLSCKGKVPFCKDRLSHKAPVCNAFLQIFSGENGLQESTPFDK